MGATMDNREETARRNGCETFAEPLGNSDRIPHSPGDKADTSRTSTPNKHNCPLCWQSFSPTAAICNFPPCAEGGANDEKRRMKSITYFGRCPNGHTVYETVEA